MSLRSMIIDAPKETKGISDLDFWSPVLNDTEDWSEFQGILDAIAGKGTKGGPGHDEPAKKPTPEKAKPDD